MAVAKFKSKEWRELVVHGLVQDDGSLRPVATGSSKGLEVLSVGANWHGQLGQSTSRRREQASPLHQAVSISLPDGEQPQQIACGRWFSALLTSTGHVYAWGLGKQGQLGCRIDSWCQPKPLLVSGVLSSVQVVAIECGQEHVLALSSTGDIYSWGSNKDGQLGHGDHLAQSEPRKLAIERELPFSHIAAGDRHSAAISHGKLYTWGCGACGQLGHGQLPAYGLKEPHLLQPTIVEVIDARGGATLAKNASVGFRSIVCGPSCTIATTTTDEVYLCGVIAPCVSTPRKQMDTGICTTMSDRMEPLDLPLASGTASVGGRVAVRQVACGKTHLLLLTRDGNVYSAGAGDHGQLGHGRSSNLLSLELILEGKHIVHISAGRYHSVALSACGSAFTWGSGEHGQLCHAVCNDDGADTIPIPRLTDSLMHRLLLQAACGDYHTLFLSTAPLEGSANHLLSPEFVAWQQAENKDYEAKVSSSNKHATVLQHQLRGGDSGSNTGRLHATSQQMYAESSAAHSAASNLASEAETAEQILEIAQLRHECKANIEARFGSASEFSEATKESSDYAPSLC